MPELEHPEYFKARMIEVILSAIKSGRPLQKAVEDVIRESQTRAMDEARAAMQKIGS